MKLKMWSIPMSIQSISKPNENLLVLDELGISFKEK